MTPDVSDEERVLNAAEALRDLGHEDLADRLVERATRGDRPLTPKQKIERAEALADEIVRDLLVEEGEVDGLHNAFHLRADTAMCQLREAASMEKARWEGRDYEAVCRDCEAAFATEYEPSEGTQSCPVCGGTMDVSEGDVELPDVFSDIRSLGENQ